MEPLTVDFIAQAVRGTLRTDGEDSHAMRALVSGVSTDSRSIEKGQLFFAIKGERYDGHDFAREAVSKSRTLAVLSRPLEGVPSLLVKDTVEALGDLARAYRRRLGKNTIAITGTNGKTTTKEMTALVLGVKYRVRKNRGNLNNLIGLPLSVLEMDGGDELGVFEMGMSAQGEIARMCQISEPVLGVITNISACHLESLGDVEGVARAKGELLEYLDQDKKAILNFDDPMLREMAKGSTASITGFGVECDAPIRARDVHEVDWGISFELESGGDFMIPIPGIFNVYNALAAIGVGEVFGISPQEAGEALRRLVPEKRRMGRIPLGGVMLIDDSYNANPASVVCALQVLSSMAAKRRIAVLGDMLELGATSKLLHEKVGLQVKKLGIDVLYVHGKDVEHTAQSARRSGVDCVREFPDKSELIAALKALLKDGDVILVKGSRAMGMEEIVQALVLESTEG